MPESNTIIKIGMTSPHVARENLINAFKKFDKKSEAANFSTVKQAVKDTESFAREKVDVVLLPEVIAIIPQQDKRHILRLLAATARSNKTTLIAGLITRGKDKDYNSAYMFLPNGVIALRHDKVHLVPGHEAHTFAAGKEDAIHISKTKNQGVWGVLICRDMDYEQPARQYSLDGANILFVPGWDFDSDAWMHGRYAYMRAVENGYAVARAGRAGLLILVDSRGRVVKMVSALTGTAPQEALIGALHIGDGKTFYSEYGSWFAWICCFLFALGFSVLFRSKN